MFMILVDSLRDRKNEAKHYEMIKMMNGGGEDVDLLSLHGVR